jgi:hypothetical protein
MGNITRYKPTTSHRLFKSDKGVSNMRLNDEDRTIIDWLIDKGFNISSLARRLLREEAMRLGYEIKKAK